MEEHRAKRLCFYCHQRFYRDHSCSQKEKLELQLIEYEDDEDEDLEGETEVVEDEQEIAECLYISLHAVQGDTGPSAIRIQGQVGKRQIQILVDNRATYDFLDFALAKKLGWKGNTDPVTEVEVAGGIHLNGYGVWKDFKWRMQGQEFQWDLRIMEIKSYDLVLGMK